jgi:hypothetical protein
VSWYVHITRAERWAEAEQTPITREEWLACVDADEELRRVTPAEVEAQKPFVKADDAAWIERLPGGGERVLAWFGYHKGYVDVRNPDGETLRKMADVAEDLHANVVDENDNLLVDPGGPEKPTWRDAPAPPRPRKARDVPVVAIAGVAIVAIGLAVLFWLLLRD